MYISSHFSGAQLASPGLDVDNRGGRQDRPEQQSGRRYPPIHQASDFRHQCVSSSSADPKEIYCLGIRLLMTLSKGRGGFSAPRIGAHTIS